MGAGAQRASIRPTGRRRATGPAFVRYMPPVIASLKQLGNSGTPAEVRESVARMLELTEEELNDPMASGSSRFENQVAWARFYLSKAGYISSSKRGIWSLTEKGLSSPMTAAQALAIFQEVQRRFKRTDEATVEAADRSAPSPEDGASDPSDLFTSTAYRAQLLNIIRGLPPTGFEHLSKRLLRECGFQQVEVTGRSGDEGIDGRGLLRINAVLSIPVIFQCKRYTADRLVSASQVRDFRGAMMGRADYAILLTTGGFTSEARREARRDGVPAIELVDGPRLVEMFEQLELGLRPITTYAVDTGFFAEFQ